MDGGRLGWGAWGTWEDGRGLGCLGPGVLGAWGAWGLGSWESWVSSDLGVFREAEARRLDVRVREDAEMVAECSQESVSHALAA